MKSTELFDFRFVDREKERIIIEKFFSEDCGNTLWIKGDRGLGKTTFFNYVLSQQITYSLCYINIEPEENSIDIISELLVELQKHSSVNFFTQIKENYKEFYNSSYKNTKNITEIIFPQLSNIVSIILDAAYTAVTWDKKQKNTISLIVEYLETILKDKQICICIDNFSRCDLKTAEIIYCIFKSFATEKRFRSCIITTSEDLGNPLMDSIHSNLPFKEIRINALDKYTYFHEILSPKFDLNEFRPEDIKNIYDKCNGSPKKLSTIISQLLENNAIDFAELQKAKINKKTLLGLLKNEDIRFKDDDFSQPQKWIIFSYICQEKVVKFEHLENLALYISKRLSFYNIYGEKVFTTELLKLIDNKVLKYNQDNTITYWHDADYRDLTDIFNNSPLKGMISQYSYEFFRGCKNFTHREALLCRHAQEANIYNWEKLNFFYGKKCAREGQIFEAYNIFMRLNGKFYNLHIMWQLFIAINSYETGDYKLALQQLKTIAYDKLKFNLAQYYYWFYLGKSYYNTGNIRTAVDMLTNALNVVAKDSEKYVQTLNVLHMYYFEIDDKVEQSQKIFEYIQKNFREKYPEIWANTIRGCHNFLDNKEALMNLKEAEKILSNELEKAFIKTTIGFVQIKCNETDLAQQNFHEAYEVIKDIKIHESSYAANNLALCYMIKDDYLKAEEILTDALFWNRTDYANLVIQSNLMICCIHLKQKDAAQDYYNYLEKFMEKRNSDPILNRKVYMNLAIASKFLGETIAYNKYVQKAKTYVLNTTSEWRYYCLIGESDKHRDKRPVCKCDLITSFDPWFLVYAHD